VALGYDRVRALAVTRRPISLPGARAVACGLSGDATEVGGSGQKWAALTLRCRQRASPTRALTLRARPTNYHKSVI
jgi:hypothetical protein